jgi:hypothetical protein
MIFRLQAVGRLLAGARSVRKRTAYEKPLKTKGRWGSSLLPVGRSKVWHFPDPIFLTEAWSEKAREGQKNRVKKMGPRNSTAVGVNFCLTLFYCLTFKKITIFVKCLL